MRSAPCTPNCTRVKKITALLTRRFVTRTATIRDVNALRRLGTALATAPASSKATADMSQMAYLIKQAGDCYEQQVRYGDQAAPVGMERAMQIDLEGAGPAHVDGYHVYLLGALLRCGVAAEAREMIRQLNQVGRPLDEAKLMRVVARLRPLQLGPHPRTPLALLADTADWAIPAVVAPRRRLGSPI